MNHPTFQLTALPPEPFTTHFAKNDSELAAQGMRRVIADAKPGYPCRVSLDDAQPGETLLLLAYQHQSALSPYRASGAIFVREHARQAMLAPGEIAQSMRIRLLSVRAYDADDMLVGAEVCEGSVIDVRIAAQFAAGNAVYLHLHYARQGCYACRVNRVG